MTRFLTAIAFIFSCVFSAKSAECQTAEVKPEMYFDLGNVIVDTRDWNNVRYVPGAKDYIADLKSKGYRTHLSVNFVDRLGPEVYRTCEEKFAGVVRFLESKWHDDIPFEWTQFQSIILPPSDQQRKPRPNMFVTALASSCPTPVLHQGEDPSEIRTAKFLGLAYWQPNLAAGVGMIPESEIKDQVARTARFSYPDDCAIDISDRCELSSADMALIIAAMPSNPHPLPNPAALMRKEF